MQAAEPVKRTSEIEDVSNLYLIHPISSWLTPKLAARRVSPNTVSFAGMAFGILAGFAYFHYQSAICAILGFILMIAWHVMDGTDGQLARLTRSQSELGKILDGVCDYVTFTAVYLGLAFALSQQGHPWIWLLVAVSGLFHAFQSAGYEMQRQEYNFWGLQRNSAKPGIAKPVRQSSGASGVSALLLWLYGRVQYLAGGESFAFHEKFGKLLAARPEQADVMRSAYRATFASSIRRWSIQSANYRTLAIFIFALIKLPALYFVFEIAGLTLIQFALLALQSAKYKAFLQRIPS